MLRCRDGEDQVNNHTELLKYGRAVRQLTAQAIFSGHRKLQISIVNYKLQKNRLSTIFTAPLTIIITPDKRQLFPKLSDDSTKAADEFDDRLDHHFADLLFVFENACSVKANLLFWLSWK